MQIFIKTVSKCGDCSALRVKRHGYWWTWNYKEYYKDVTKIAKSLIKTGLEFHHGVGLIGYNAPEWSIAYTASIMVTCLVNIETVITTLVLKSDQYHKNMIVFHHNNCLYSLIIGRRHSCGCIYYK